MTSRLIFASATVKRFTVALSPVNGLKRHILNKKKSSARSQPGCDIVCFVNLKRYALLLCVCNITCTWMSATVCVSVLPLSLNSCT